MKTTSLHALVLSHVAFEDLGSLEQPLLDRGFKIEPVNASAAHSPLPQAGSCDLLVVLGGPISVYDQQHYPFLTNEISCIADRLAARKPTLGICLGAQLTAAALGARVYPGQNGVEIGWSPLQAAANVPPPAWFAPLLTPGLSVFHWHGDTFDLPPGSVNLARTQLYEAQAFAVDNFALGLQFHPEVSSAGLESWYVGHAGELDRAGISTACLRDSARKHAPPLQEAAALFFRLWLDYIL